MIKEGSAARHAFQIYIDCIKKRDARWIPHLKIMDIWPEAKTP
jgi:hypothetical protein